MIKVQAIQPLKSTPFSLFLSLSLSLSFSFSLSQFFLLNKQALPLTVILYLLSLLHIADLGEGWAPAILNTEAEHDFIREADRDVVNDMGYWIDGSTNRAGFPHTFSYSEYFPDRSQGNFIFDIFHYNV